MSGYQSEAVVLISSFASQELHHVKRAAEVRVLQAHGFTTLGQLAFVVGQPGQVIPDTAWDAWRRAHVPGASAADLASLRRLLVGAQTLALAQMRTQITEPDSASKRVAQAEKERRLASLRRLSRACALAR